MKRGEGAAPGGARSFSRGVYIPDGVDKEKFTCPVQQKAARLLRPHGPSAKEEKNSLLDENSTMELTWGHKK